jgi:hypothetical protein
LSNGFYPAILPIRTAIPPQNTRYLASSKDKRKVLSLPAQEPIFLDFKTICYGLAFVFGIILKVAFFLLVKPFHLENIVCPICDIARTSYIKISVFASLRFPGVGYYVDMNVIFLGKVFAIPDKISLFTIEVAVTFGT